MCSQLLELTENYTPQVSEYKVSGPISAAVDLKINMKNGARNALLTGPCCCTFQEGKIVSFDHTTRQIELELQNVSQGMGSFLI